MVTQLRHRGLERVGCVFTLAAADYGPNFVPRAQRHTCDASISKRAICLLLRKARQDKLLRHPGFPVHPLREGALPMKLLRTGNAAPSRLSWCARDRSEGSSRARPDFCTATMEACRRTGPWLFHYGFVSTISGYFARADPSLNVKIMFSEPLIPKGEAKCGPTASNEH